MTVKIAPDPRPQNSNSAGVPYSGGKLFTYAAGSTTKQNTYTDSTGGTPNSNPIVLDSAGRPPYDIWLTTGLTYKFVLAPSTDTDPPTSPIWTSDNLSGINDTATNVTQWVTSGLTPTYVSATSFTLVGDQTTEFHVGRRIQTTNTAGTIYSRISASAYTTLTTVTVVNDYTGTLDSGLSAVNLSLLRSDYSALPHQTVSSTGLGFTGNNTHSGTETFSNTVTMSGKQFREATGANIASATTVDLSAATGNLVHITGTTATTGVTLISGTRVRCIADAAWPLTYNATTMKINGGASYTCAAGDRIEFYYDGTTTFATVTKQDGTAVVGGTTLVAVQATTSGTNVDFTGLPSGIKRIEITFSGISTNGTSAPQIQIGDNTGFKAGSYLGAVMSGAEVDNHSTGFKINSATFAASGVLHGGLTLLSQGNNSWVATGATGRSDITRGFAIGGSNTLTNTLDRIRFTTVGGDTFDAGSIGLIYWT